MKQSTRWAAAILLVAGLAPLARAAGPCAGISSQLDPFDFESITVSTTAIGATAAVYAPSGLTAASYAVVTVETNSIRWRVDGVANPTAAVGHLADDKAVIQICGTTAIARFRAIRVSADATLRVTYYRAR